MIRHGIHIPRPALADFCRRNHIRKLALFGSILGDNFTLESDVDVLVEFESGHRIGLLRVAAVERELTMLMGRRVDLRTPAELSRYFREEVVQNSEVQFAQG